MGKIGAIVSVAICIVFWGVLAVTQPQPKTASGKFRISGTVIDDVQGDPLPGIELSIAMGHSENPLATVITGADGSFRFDNLSVGKYPLMAKGRGYPRQGYEEHLAFFTAIVTGPGLKSENLIFRLKHDAAISGTVTDEFNDPVSAADVLLFITGRGDAPQAVLGFRKVKTDDSGQFTFNELSDATYYLAVVARPWYARSQDQEDSGSGLPGEPIENGDSVPGTPSNKRTYSQVDVAFQATYYVNATDAREAMPIVLKPGEHATADLHLVAVPALRLRVHNAETFANSSSPLKLSQQIFGLTWKTASQPVYGDGVEFSGLAPGQYILEYPELANIRPKQQLLNLVSDTEVGPADVIDLMSKVKGVVQTEGSTEICQRCIVQLIDQNTREGYDARSGINGFEFEGGIRPGHYLVSVRGEPPYIVKDVVAVGASTVKHDLVIPPGAFVNLKILITKHYGSIDGIALKERRPATAIAVFLVPDDPEHNLILFRRDQSDSDGTFSFHGVLPASYTVIAVEKGWDLAFSDPVVLKPYLKDGVRLTVLGTETQQITVNVQPMLTLK